MVRTDPITNSKIALTNMNKPKDSSLRQNSMYVDAHSQRTSLAKAASRNHAASAAAAAAPSAGGFPNGSPATHLHDQH